MNVTILIVWIIIGIGILASNIVWGIRCLNKKHYLKVTKIDKNDKQYSFDKYSELSDRIQWIQTTIIMVGVVITILGWNIKSNIVSEIKKETIGELLNRIQDITTSIDSLSEEKNILLTSYENIKVQNNKIIKEISHLNKIYEPVNNKIENIIGKSNTIIQAYIVKDIKNISKQGKLSRLYFKDMQPINAEQLPVFKSAPIVGIFINCGWDIEITNITSEYIEVDFWSSPSTKPDFMFWILEPIINNAPN